MTKAKQPNADPAAFLGTAEGKSLMNSIGAVSAGLRGIAGFLRKVLDGSTGLALPDKAKRKTATKTPKAQRDPNVPRRPPSSFLMFMDEMRKRAVEEGRPKISKLDMGILWRELDRQTRDSYESRYTEAYKRFEEERTKWEAENGPMSHPRKRKTEGDDDDAHLGTDSTAAAVAAAPNDFKPPPTKRAKQAPKATPVAVPEPIAVAPAAPTVPKQSSDQVAKQKKSVTVVSPPAPAPKKVVTGAVKQSKGSESDGSITSPRTEVFISTPPIVAEVPAAVGHIKPGTKPKGNGTTKGVATKAGGIKSDDEAKPVAVKRQADGGAAVHPDAAKKKKKKEKENTQA